MNVGWVTLPLLEEGRAQFVWAPSVVHVMPSGNGVTSLQCSNGSEFVTRLAAEAVIALVDAASDALDEQDAVEADKEYQNLKESYGV